MTKKMLDRKELDGWNRVLYNRPTPQQVRMGDSLCSYSYLYFDGPRVYEKCTQTKQVCPYENQRECREYCNQKDINEGMK